MCGEEEVHGDEIAPVPPPSGQWTQVLSKATPEQGLAPEQVESHLLAPLCRTDQGSRGLDSIPSLSSPFSGARLPHLYSGAAAQALSNPSDLSRDICVCVHVHVCVHAAISPSPDSLVEGRKGYLGPWAPP